MVSTMIRTATGPGTAGDRAQYNAESSREKLSGKGLTNMNTQRTGFGDARMRSCFDDVMTLLCHVAKATRMEASVTHSGQGAMLASGGAVLGGMLVGPPGIFVGGAVGGLIGWITSGQFKSVPKIIKELPDAEKQKLCAETMAVVKNLYWTNSHHLIELVVTNSALMDEVLDVLINYLTNELKAEIKYGK